MSPDTSTSILSEADYFEQRLDDQINWFDTKSQTNQQTYKRLRLTEIVAAAAIPLLAGLGTAIGISASLSAHLVYWLLSLPAS